jgi:hypothetical protein
LRIADFGDLTIFDFTGRVRYLGTIPSEGLPVDQYEPGVYLVLNKNAQRKLVLRLEP